MAKIICPHCGNEVEFSAQTPFCTECGKRLTVEAEVPVKPKQPEPKKTAGIQIGTKFLLIAAVGLILVLGLVFVLPQLMTSPSETEWYLHTYTYEGTLDDVYAYYKLDCTEWPPNLSEAEDDVWEWTVEVTSEPNKLTGVVFLDQQEAERVVEEGAEHYEDFVDSISRRDAEFKYMKDFRKITFYWKPPKKGVYYLIMINEKEPPGDLKYRLIRNIYTQSQWDGGTKIDASQIPTDLDTKISARASKEAIIFQATGTPRS